ncbi:MAG: S26 family signal peptidase, partial [Planctomycetota bacterium]|nr:S26 family signal peptidase [Planctomycetota bacterium]
MGTELEIRPVPDSPVDEATLELGASSAAPQTLDWPPTSPAAILPTQLVVPDRGRRVRGRRFWRDVCLGGVVVMLVHVFLVQISVVRGLSMAPSLQDGDRLMVDRVSYSMANVSRFDVVVLRYPRNPDV